MENKKLKKKKQQLFLLTDVNCLSQEEVIFTIKEIREKIIKIFRNHIGLENSISPYELFYQIFNINPILIDIFKRNYWYSIVKKIISQMRREGEIFIINKGSSLFVLQTQEENIKFKEGINRHIFYLEEIKRKGDEWIKKKKWKELI